MGDQNKMAGDKNANTVCDLEYQRAESWRKYDFIIITASFTCFHYNKIINKQFLYNKHIRKIFI